MGSSELMIIAVAVLIMFGGKQLPGLLRSVAKFMADLKRVTTQIKREAGLDIIDDIRDFRPTETKSSTPKPPKTE